MLPRDSGSCETDHGSACPSHLFVGYGETVSLPHFAWEPTDLLLQGLLSLDMVFFKFVVQLLECFEIFDGDAHFLDFLNKELGTSHMICGTETDLAEHEIPLCKLYEHLFCTECIVEL